MAGCHQCIGSPGFAWLADAEVGSRGSPALTNSDPRDIKGHIIIMTCLAALASLSNMRGCSECVLARGYMESNIPWSQRGPVNPGWHIQEKLFTWSTHSAPFWHWEGAQSSISREIGKIDATENVGVEQFKYLKFNLLKPVQTPLPRLITVPLRTFSWKLFTYMGRGETIGLNIRVFVRKCQTSEYSKFCTRWVFLVHLLEFCFSKTLVVPLIHWYACLWVSINFMTWTMRSPRQVMLVNVLRYESTDENR